MGSHDDAYDMVRGEEKGTDASRNRGIVLLETLQSTAPKIRSDPIALLAS